MVRLRFISVQETLLRWEPINQMLNVYVSCESIGRHLHASYKLWIFLNMGALKEIVCDYSTCNFLLHITNNQNDIVINRFVYGI